MSSTKVGIKRRGGFEKTMWTYTTGGTALKKIGCLDASYIGISWLYTRPTPDFTNTDRVSVYGRLCRIAQKQRYRQKVSLGGLAFWA